MDVIAATVLAAVLALGLWCARGCACVSLPRAPEANIEVDSTSAPTPVESAKPARPDYMALAETRFRGPVKYLFNTPRTHVICLDQSRTRMPVGPGATTRMLRFFVYDLSTDGIVFADSLDNARIQWETDTSLKVTITPGMVPDIEPREYGYRFNVVTRTREEM